ncbi:MAG: permease, partial [Anaerolineaceae bacterium]|nr:permease [Anaerolineaceae bacterium]
QVGLFTNVFATIPLGINPSGPLMTFLSKLNISLQGFALIIMLVVIAVTAWLGFNKIHDGFTGWTYAAISFIMLTILIASPAVQVGSSSIGINGRLIGEALVVIAIVTLAAKAFTKDELTGWIWETWKFVKQIFVILIVGVFAAGIIRVIIPEAWVQKVAGSNTIWANLIGVLFGVFMYFPTLVEVPIAKMFLDLGMARGPLLAYLLADPELSLQSILVLNKVMGGKKTAIYVSLVAIMTTLAGYLFGVAISIL